MSSSTPHYTYVTVRFRHSSQLTHGLSLAGYKFRWRYWERGTGSDCLSTFRSQIDNVPPAQHSGNFGIWHLQGRMCIPWTVCGPNNAGIGRRDVFRCNVCPCSISFPCQYCLDLTVWGGHRLYWLGLFEAERPQKWPLFFHVDLAPVVLRVISVAFGLIGKCHSSVISQEINEIY